MGRVRIVAPGSDRVDLSDGDWIEIKSELNNGDQKKLESAGLKPPIMVDGRIISPIDWSRHDMERAMIFLTDWSFTDDKSNKLPLRYDTLCALDVETFDEINQAIIKHVMETAAAKKAKRAEMAQIPSSTPPETPEPVVSAPTSTS